MKRLIAILLVAACLTAMLAACGKPAEPATTPTAGETTPAVNVDPQDLADALEYLRTIYKEVAEKTPADFERVSVLRVGGVEYPVTWTADADESAIKVVDNGNGTVTIDVNEQNEKDLAYTLTASLTDAAGNVQSYSWKHLLPGSNLDQMKEIVDMAYALDKGATLEGEFTLAGEIISVDSAWSDQYKNITVTIIVEGREDKPVQCYRLKGEGAESLAIGDKITVFGVLKNYNGTIEFDAGCQLLSVIKGDGVAIEAPTDPLEIMKAAYDLKVGLSLPYEVTLTGTITNVDTAYSTQYQNISVTMDVDGADGYSILCYRLKGTGADTLNVNDVITVSGQIKNYAGTIEFNYPTLVSVTQKAPPSQPSDPCAVVDAAYALAKNKSLPYNATLTGTVIDVETEFSEQYKNISVLIAVDGRENKPILCYRLNGVGMRIIEEGDVVTVFGMIKHYYDSKTNTSKIEFDAGCKLIDLWKGIDYGPLSESGEYRMYVNQANLGQKLYFNGGINDRNFLTTTESKDDAVFVYVDRTNDGVLFYFMENNARVYINAVDNGSGGVKLALSNTDKTYFTYNTEIGAYTVTVNDTEYYLGTYNKYNTLSLSKISYISTSFPVQFETNDPAADTKLSIADAIALGLSKDHNTYTEGKYYVTGKITEVYNTQYGNMYITDGEGNTLTIYGTYDATGANRYDAMSVKPVAGDTVTIYGIVGQYGGKAQIKNGWITEHIPGEGSGDVEDPEVPENKDPAADSKLTVSEAIALGSSKEHNTYTTGKYYVTGEITEIYNETYGNMKIKDAAGNILTIYGTYNEDGTVRFDKLETKPAVGDTITVYGIIGQYSNTPQMKNGWIIPEKEAPAIPEADSKVSIADAIALGTSMEHNTYTEDKYYVSGEITEVYNTQYGNMKIKDTAGNILTIYGTYDADGTNRYDSMTVKPVAGDTVTIYGIIGQYNGTAQIKNGWITEHIPAGDAPVEPEVPENNDPAADSKLTVSEAIALGSSKEHNTYTEGKYYVSGEITEVYNTQYGNMKIKDAAGNILTIYGTYDADGTNRYDAMEVKPVAGDTVTVYGIIGQYNGTAQVKNGWITEHIPVGGETEDPEAPVEPDAPALTASTISFADKANRVSLSEEQQVWAQNGITFTNNLGASTSPVADYANPVRLYAGSDIIIAANGMKKIVINVNANKGTGGLVGALNAAGIAHTVSGNVVTIEFSSAVNSLTISGLTAQVRFDSITVYA